MNHKFIDLKLNYMVYNFLFKFISINSSQSDKNNLESSKLWKEWLVAVAEGKKFDKVFKGGVN